jgi:hypothetical protein
MKLPILRRQHAVGGRAVRRRKPAEDQCRCDGTGKLRGDERRHVGGADTCEGVREGARDRDRRIRKRCRGCEPAPSQLSDKRCRITLARAGQADVKATDAWTFTGTSALPRQDKKARSHETSFVATR